MPEEPDTADPRTATPGLRDLLALVAGGSMPLQAGTIALDEDNQIRLRQNGDPIRFCFAYRGVDFDVRLETASDARIVLSAELGKVPYSIESGLGRRMVRRVVEATADLPAGRIELSAAQDMSIVATAQPPAPLTPASVLATVTALLLGLGPYIDLLRRVFETAEGQGHSGRAAPAAAAPAHGKSATAV